MGLSSTLAKNPQSWHAGLCLLTTRSLEATSFNRGWCWWGFHRGRTSSDECSLRRKGWEAVFGTPEDPNTICRFTEAPAMQRTHSPQSPATCAPLQIHSSPKMFISANQTTKMTLSLDVITSFSMVIANGACRANRKMKSGTQVVWFVWKESTTVMLTIPLSWSERRYGPN